MVEAGDFIPGTQIALNVEGVTTVTPGGGAGVLQATDRNETATAVIIGRIRMVCSLLAFKLSVESGRAKAARFFYEASPVAELLPGSCRIR
jgi:hypothetical protein